MTASGGCSGRRGERRLGRDRRRLDVVAGAAQAGLQRAQDLRLVVDDEDPRVPLTLGSLPVRARSAARARTSRPAGPRLHPDAARRWPRRSRARSRGRARCRRSPAPRVERLEDALAGRAAATPGPAVAHAHEHFALACARAAELDRHRRRRELERVLEHVGEHALDLRGVDLRRRSGLPAVARR